jgi:hypothetical protein
MISLTSSSTIKPFLFLRIEAKEPILFRKINVGAKLVNVVDILLFGFWLPQQVLIFPLFWRLEKSKSRVLTGFNSW